MSKRAVFSILLSATVFGCAGDAGDGGKTELLGEYALTAMDGQPPPVPSPEQPGAPGPLAHAGGRVGEVIPHLFYPVTPVRHLTQRGRATHAAMAAD